MRWRCGSRSEPGSANYFEAMGIRLIKGRGFTSADRADSSHVTIINETLARRICPGEDPIGKRLKQGFPEEQNPWREVIGVVANTVIAALLTLVSLVACWIPARRAAKVDPLVTLCND